MDIITLDFETYYGKGHSLSTMTTEAYIRDPKFEAIGFSIKVNNKPAKWFTGDATHLKMLLKCVNWSKAAVLCHNTVFDGAILSWHFGIQPKMYLDTLSMARALHSIEVGNSLRNLAIHYKLGEKGDEVVKAYGKRRVEFTVEELAAYGAYCSNDTELTYQLFLKMRSMLPVSEMLIIDQTLRMFTDPVVELDLDILDSHLTREQERKSLLLEGISPGDPEGARSMLMSNPKMAAMLTKLGVDPPKKISAATGKATFAFSKTDKEFAELLEHEDSAVAALVAARLGVKSTIEESRTQSLIGVASRGALPIMLNYYGAHTGRFSGGDKMNLQNLPRGGALRRAIKAPKGKVFVACDSSQIEARVVAYLGGQKDLLEAFRQKRDVYSEFASKVYGRSITKANTTERHVGKTSILGLGYGMGPVKFARTLEIGQGGISVVLEMAEALRITGFYRQQNHGIVGYWRKCGRALESMAEGKSGHLGMLTYDGPKVMLPNAMTIKYPLLHQHTQQGSIAAGFRYAGRQATYRSAMIAKVSGGSLEELDWVKIYGGKCLAGNTEVLTDKGWVRLRDVTRAHRVWDGVEWVKHDGLIYQGKKATTVVNGVRMTPDHNVLTERGWRCASSSEGLHRAGFWLPDGGEVSGGKWPRLNMGLPVQLRDGSFSGGYRPGKICPHWRAPVVRMQGRGREQIARLVTAPSVLGVAVHAGPVPLTYAPSMAQLRSSGYQGVPGVGALIRGVLGGHGADVSGRADAGSEGQQRRLYSGELPVGDTSSPSREPAQLAPSGHSQGTQGDWRFQIDAPVSVEPEPVYDILNAGPNARFVVRGSSGPFIVHNCAENITQALARIIVADQMAIIGRRYKVVLQVHDEVVIVCDEAEAEEAKAFMEQVMSTPPKWAPDLPVGCEAGIGGTYGDCK